MGVKFIFREEIVLKPNPREEEKKSSRGDGCKAIIPYCAIPIPELSGRSVGVDVHRREACRDIVLHHHHHLVSTLPAKHPVRCRGMQTLTGVELEDEGGVVECE